MNKQPDLLKKYFSKMATVAKNGVWLGAFLTELDFSELSNTLWRDYYKTGLKK